MRLTSFVYALVAISSALALYIPSLEEAGDAIEKRADVVATTGIPGAVHPRLEVRQMLFTKPNQWILFILAMKRFQQKAQNDPTDWYQIAGIHGVPRVNYNGVGQCSTCGGTDGYCPHDSILFPGRHRAYLALFEQQFKTVVDQIAAEFPASRRPFMQGAASTIRFPYWDWAARPTPGNPTLPRVVSDIFITVNGPQGQQTMVNPLFRHDFANPSALVYSPFVNWKVTLRYPNSNANTASSTTQSSIRGFENIRANMQDQVYQMFSTCSDFSHFANDDAGSSTTRCSNSLEGIHNTIHTTAGGPGSSTASGGHMTYLATAAFDPIFWLHHCNTDRLFALWQNQHPNAWGASQVAPHNTWTVRAGSTQNLDSPLTPFYKDTTGSNFWTTNQVRRWDSTFHYTYPEFSNSDGSRGAIAGYINRLYGPSATATAGSSKRDAAPEPMAGWEVIATPNEELTKRQDDAIKAENGSLFQYVANIQTPRYALNGSYYIYLFQGEPGSENPADWILDEALIGPMGVLAQPDMTEKNLIAAGSVPLTRALTNAVFNGSLSDMTEANAVPYLREHLTWRVAANATAVDPGTIGNFKIGVFGSTAAPPPDDNSLPEWSEFIPLAEVTKQKSGGANSTEEATSTPVAKRSVLALEYE